MIELINSMVEQVSAEVIRKKPLSDLIADVFERRVSTQAVKKERKLIMETYANKFQEIVNTMPAEKRDTTMIQIQKAFVNLGSIFSEYGARFGDFVNNIVNWPMIHATPDFPKDKFYQIGLARAKAWGGFARDTTRTATAERTAYRDHFLPSAVLGGEAGAVIGGFMSLPLAIVTGVDVGVKAGLAFGAAGVAGGALVGAAAGGLMTLAMRLKDHIIGPPVVYYDLFAYTGSHGGGSIHTGGGSGIDASSSSHTAG